ncbi:MAG: hypothetical protein Kow00121_50620 [Elainellaceae cyanobacterium]
MVVEEALTIVDTLLSPGHLNPLQELIFRQCWEGKTYEEIATNSGYTTDYIRVAGSQLWQTISEATGAKTSKHNFRSNLRQLQEDWRTGKRSESLLQGNRLDTLISGKPLCLERPDGPVPLNSKFYLERFQTENRCYHEITKPGALIRIKAPSQWGKTSLAIRILDHAQSLGYKTAHVNFQQIDSTLLPDLDKFMRWFCAHLTQQLHIEPKLDEFWDADLGSKVSCSNYLRHYLLPRIDKPLVLVMDEINRIFEWPIVSQDFLPLLRFWHEEAKYQEIWEKLRIVVAYSTEILIPLNWNQSPFNVGLPVVLQEFTDEQIAELAQRHGLENHSDLQAQALRALQTLTQGHPYLIRLAFYSLAQQQVGFRQLLREAPTETGIYSSHLRGLLTVLESQPELSQLFKQVVAADAPIRLEPLAAYKLASLGLVRQIGNEVLPICELYRLYFGDRLH